ncbi:hypothetical protein ACOMHN_044796 [Nucella lapillus]
MAAKAESETVGTKDDVLDEAAYKTLAGNIFVNGAVSIMMTLAQEIGLVKLLVDTATPLTSQDVASQLRLKERYIRELLSSLAALKLIQVEKGTGGKDEPAARFYLHPSHQHAFQKNALLTIYTTTSATRMPAIRASLPQDAPNCGLLYATEEFNTWVHVTEFTKGLVANTILKTPGLKEQMEKGIQAMEVGCGTGSVMCHLAAMFPKSHFLLTDLVPEGMEHAKNTAKKMNLTNVTFQLLNIFDTTDKLNDSFDWILAFDVIHDLPYPQEGLERIRKMLKPGGNLSMVDMFMSTYLRQNIGNPTAAAMYAISTLNCIPESYQKEDSQALGACWGKEQARELVDKAGLHIIDFIDTFPENPGVFGLCMCQKPC